MATLHERLQGDMVTARKAQDKPRTLLLSTLLSEIKNKRIELQRDLGDDDLADVVRKAIKRRRESIEMFRDAKRDDLVAKERAEAEMLEVYLPPQVADTELRAAVRAAIAAGAGNIGAVMAKVMPQFKGRAEGGTINSIAREELAAATRPG